MSRPYTFQVTDGVHCVMRRSYFTCSYIVTTGDGLVAIDAGMKSTGAEMLEAIKEIGRKPTDLKAILLTHWHNDHAAGASVLARLSGRASVLLRPRSGLPDPTNRIERLARTTFRSGS